MQMMRMMEKVVDFLTVGVILSYLNRCKTPLSFPLN